MIRILIAVGLVMLASAVQAQDVTGTARAIDGDSLRVGTTEVRLFGIDAPEYRQTCRVGWSNLNCGADAAVALRSLVDDRQLICSVRDRDVYRRTVATCRLEGIDVAETLLRQGHAIVLEGAPSSYVSLGAESKSAKIGIWASEFEIPATYRAAHPRNEASQRSSPSRSRATITQTAPSARSPMYYNCAQARAAGAAPMYRGQASYNPNLDGDGDGIACEPYYGRR
jgi:endonuclease YncB( thermonuclease family)